MASSRPDRVAAAALAVPAVLALALAALVASLVTAAPASAASRTITDPRGDPGADIVSVGVRWAAGLTVTVRHAKPLRSGDVYSAYVDTRPGRAGPEFKVFASPNSDNLGLVRTTGWHGATRRVSCPGLRVSADSFDRTAPVRFFVPGRCLGDPAGAVRVTVRSERGAASDWAPGVRRAGPPVARR